MTKVFFLKKYHEDGMGGYDPSNDRPIYGTFYATQELAQAEADRLNQEAIDKYNNAQRIATERAIANYEKAVAEHNALVELGLRKGKYPHARPKEFEPANHAGLFAGSYSVGSAPLVE